MTTWDEVLEFLKGLPEVEEDATGKREVARVRGTIIAYPAGNDRSRPDSAAEDEEFVIVKIDRRERAVLLQEAPDTFFVTPHYQNYPGVIVRLATVGADQLRELLVDAWRLAAPKRLVREFDGR
jgi:hypothetical protein